MNLNTKIWLLPIGAGVAFGLSLVLNLGLNNRSSTELETLRSVDNPYLERMLRVSAGIEDLRASLQSAVAEGDASRLADARTATATVRRALEEMRALQGQESSVVGLGTAFESYNAIAARATQALLTHQPPGDLLLRMRDAQRVLGERSGERLRAAREALETRFTRVARAQRLNQWASALTALLVLAGLAVSSRMIIQSVWRELQDVHNRLLAAARVAGMAEIATNVLHNVGNVLNSVNVSAGLASARLRNSKVKGLARAVGLLDEHPADLGRFLTEDARGRLMIPYLRELAQTLEAEQAELGQELGTLGKSVDHIKEIIATQQSYAGAQQVLVQVRVEELLDDAVRMNAGALARHKVEVVKKLADLPALALDRNRLLQILVNLISNAKQSLDRVETDTPCITLESCIAEHAGRRVLRLQVIDNGEGIPAENLTRIFSHGFTTRSNGHGFGLHSCVLAARELGGELRVQSQGAGCGATFILDIPIDVAETAHE